MVRLCPTLGGAHREHVVAHRRFRRSRIGWKIAIGTLVGLGIALDGQWRAGRPRPERLAYEHCSYFSRSSLGYAFPAAGFSIRRLAAGFGNQYLTVEARPDSSPDGAAGPNTLGVEALAAEVRSFATRYRQKVETWRQRIEKLARRSQRIVVWGAGSKGVTFLNTLRIAGQVEYAVDVNPRKHGMYVAGTGQRIVPPRFLREYQPDVVILMNRIYLTEIQQLAGSLGLRGRIVCA